MTELSNTPELKPCPFCGVQPLVVAEIETLPPKPLTVKCPDPRCPARALARVEEWNTRSDLVPSQPNRLDESIAWLKKVHSMGVSEGSVVPQLNAGEMLARLDELGFGKQEPRRGNTLYAMVMDAADEIERLRRSVPSQVGAEEITAAFHRGVDAAKQAIRDEHYCCPTFCAPTFITAIARKCGFDRSGKED